MTPNNIQTQSISKQHILYACLGLVLLIWLGFFIYGKYYISTEDAYVNANVVTIATRIPGEVAQLSVTNNQTITQGSPLFQLDKTPYLLELSKSQAALSAAMASRQQAELRFNRNKNLLAKNAISKQEVDDAYANLLVAIGNQNVQKENLNQANLHLNYTSLSAPVTGQIVGLTLRMGDQVQAGQPLFSIVDHSEFWIDANFKETELTHIRPGQSASITVDMYPSHEFQGVVESISGGSGAAFSLLPPENATGNWVKITQRIPVRIKVMNVDQKHFPLRIGSSANVNVKLK